MNFLTRFSLKNAVAVFIVSFLLILAGLYSFSKLKIDLLPNIEFPQLSIEATYPGASPDDVNESVTSKIEDQVKGIEGVKSVQSVSYENVGIINLEFPFNTDLDKVEQQINSSIKELDLPESSNVDVNRFSFGSFPIFNISLFAKDDANLEKVLNDEVIPELNKIQGINSVSVGGVKEDLLQITVDKEKAAQAGLTLDGMKEQINQKAVSFPAGTLNGKELQIPVRVEEKVATIGALKKIQLKSTTNPEAKPVKLGDIAKVEAVTEQGEYTRYDGKDALSMAITKKQDANTVEVASETMKILKKYDDQLDYAIGFDSADGIEKSVETLVREGLLGALFASLAVLIFLRNFRATIIAIISIPLSLLVSAIFLNQLDNQLDISLNIMTLGGMAVAVGRVVDDSIVVIENIFRRVRRSEEGMSNELVESSTKEILKAITSSTITTVVVFLPIGFVGGITGEFFLPFALTVVFSLLASLLVAITIVPILAKFAFKKVPPEEKEGKLQRGYAKAIAWSLNHKIKILILSFILLFSSFALVPSLGFTFIPNEEQKMLQANVQLPASTSLEKTNDVSLKIEKMFADQNEISDVTTEVGSRDFSTGVKRPNQVGYFLNVKEGVNVDTFIDKVQKKMESITKEESPKATVNVQEASTGGPPTNNNVTVDLYSSNLNDLQKAAKQVENHLNKDKRLKYVTNNFSDKQKQLVVEVDPDKAAEYGVSGFQLLGTISDQTKPVSVGDLKLDNTKRAVQLSYDKDLSSVKEIKDLQVFTERGPVLVKDIADVRTIDTFTSIQKLDGKVFARVEADIKGDDVQAVTKDVVDGVKKLDLPKDVSLDGGGGSDETVEVFQSLGLAILTAIGLVYLTMLVTFGKARIPFIILSSLIFVPIGSLVGLVLAKEPLSVSVMIGFLMLIGIVTTNAIVLVDRITQNREQKGMTIRQSLIEAGKTRLRPILMTAFATIAALIPLALTTSSGTLISKGLAITVIGGLASSTLLTLIIIPVVYELFFAKQVKREKQLEKETT
ncbi:efflux RND transporter permease subunit [Priestia megaterium]|uniref:efflux RND transporter permease subunit n=1 Tax=Priestia megaterium TaxID=1404 RepID=UPI0023DA1E1A|nr:efflux RND transporter permease subunit [Priestia megaterium]MDF2055475.1 efflux RND transporter permease subunit [Priestia megaterium]MDF2059437.1 efflux RND transporter permease subunit [Priestia megaterium]